jgi:hypothetical protein
VEKISWTECVRNEVVLQGVKTERNIRPTKIPRKPKWISHILRRNCLLKHVPDRKIEGRSDGKTKKKTQAATG